MKRVILAFLPAFLLAGCSDRQANYAKQRADEDKEIIAAINSCRLELDQEWQNLPQDLKENVRAKREYAFAQGRLDSAMRFINPSGAYSVRQPLSAKEEIAIVRADGLQYLHRATKATDKHADLSTEAVQLSALIHRICPGNIRAQFHLLEANKDLERAKTAGYCLELLETAGEHLNVVNQLVLNPLQPLERMSLTASVRDRFFQLQTLKTVRSPMQLAHLDAASKWLQSHREALALAGNQEVLAKTAAIHLDLVSNAGCKTEKNYDERAVEYANVFEKIMITEVFVQENCPNNHEAVKFVQQAHEIHTRWRSQMTRTGWWQPEKGDPINVALDSARKAITKHPRTGTK